MCIRDSDRDGALITRLFFFIAPSPRAHLDLLGRLSRLLTRGPLRDLLTKEATDDVIFATMAAADMVNGPNVEVKSCLRVPCSCWPLGVGWRASCQARGSPERGGRTLWPARRRGWPPPSRCCSGPRIGNGGVCLPWGAISFICDWTE